MLGQGSPSCGCGCYPRRHDFLVSVKEREERRGRREIWVTMRCDAVPRGECGGRGGKGGERDTGTDDRVRKVKRGGWTEDLSEGMAHQPVSRRESVKIHLARDFLLDRQLALGRVEADEGAPALPLHNLCGPLRGPPKPCGRRLVKRKEVNRVIPGRVLDPNTLAELLGSHLHGRIDPTPQADRSSRSQMLLLLMMR